MSKITGDYVEEYIREITPKASGHIKLMEDYAKANHVPIVEPEVGQFLRLLINIHKPKSILEIGTAIGYSASIMALEGQDIKIKTIEKNEDLALIAVDNLKAQGLEDRVQVINARAEDVLDHLDQNFDMIFLDGPKGQYLEFFNQLTGILNPGGLIVSDNVLFKGMVASDDLLVRRKKTLVRRLRTYLDHINNIEGYKSSIIPIGDGVALTYKNQEVD